MNLQTWACTHAGWSLLRAQGWHAGCRRPFLRRRGPQECLLNGACPELGAHLSPCQPSPAGHSEKHGAVGTARNYGRNENSGPGGQAAVSRAPGTGRPGSCVWNASPALPHCLAGGWTHEPMGTSLWMRDLGSGKGSQAVEGPGDAASMSISSLRCTCEGRSHGLGQHGAACPVCPSVGEGWRRAGLTRPEAELSLPQPHCVRDA